VCAEQWRQSVEQAAESLSRTSPADVHVLRYESFVAEPTTQIQSIATFLGIPLQHASRTSIAAGISTRSVGNGSRTLDAATIAAIEPRVMAANRVVERFQRLHASQRPDNAAA
jgi:hypothetical protein